MGKKIKNWDGVDRRKGKKPYFLGDKRKDKSDKVSADFVSTKNDERYQFENLIIIYKARFNVWQVNDMKKPSYQQLLFEVTGYDNGNEAFIWAKEYIKELKYNKEGK